MTQVIQRVEVTLRSFYVFNSDFGQKEGDEHKKVLYYFPDDIELNTKIKDVGLSEAIIAFTGTFVNNDGSCKALHTQKTTQLFYQPEPGYWMVLVINVPKEIRSKDGVEVADYRGSEVHDRIYRSVLEQCYSMFRLFTGTFRMNLNAGGALGDEAREQLQQRLSLFFDKFLLSLKLPAYDIMDVMRSIQYLPLDKLIFLRAHNFINMIRATFPAIAETILLYNEQVVCGAKLDPIDLYSLFEYIVGTLLQKTQTEFGGAGLARSNSSVADAYRNGAFITGPEDGEHATEPPKVYLAAQHPDTLQAYYLIVYRAMNATLCLFVHDLPQNDFYAELHSYVGPQLTSISRDIGDTLVKQGKQSSPLATSIITAVTDGNATDVMTPKYLFINEQSLKHLSNISVDRDRRRPRVAPSIPTDVMNVIADLANDDAAADSSNATASSSFEVQVKTTNDFWIVKRRCNWRQYYVIIFNSKATLLDVTNEAKRLFEQELTDDVFFDK